MDALPLVGVQAQGIGKHIAGDEDSKQKKTFIHYKKLGPALSQRSGPSGLVQTSDAPYNSPRASWELLHHVFRFRIEIKTGNMHPKRP
jgi:hypothetical protein